MFVHTKLRYSIKDLETLLGIGRTKINSEMNQGRLGYFKDGGRKFSGPDDVDRYNALCQEESKTLDRISKSEE